eukprot:TRINITY_DN12513_c0_g1_i1.p1 TRINITY_DN12513_c0_g1~~TRINITY_DN12513_c0_g1_i1.p1  ORF type:complete len:570 (-),score=148.82 TRINITY_DN12513_c0_g1_i1:78-1787(-)
MSLLPRDGVPSLQSLACYAIEDLVRKSTDQVKDPGCRNLISMTEEQQKIAETINEYVENLCPNVVSEILSRVLSYNGDTKRKASPLDVWALMHPGFKKLSIPRTEVQYHPIPNTHKAILDSLFKLSYLEHLNLSGLDEHSTPGDYNDLMHSSEVKEHYLFILDDCIRQLPNLITINLGTLVNNNILRTIGNTCAGLKEIRLRGPAYVTDLGVRYLTGMNTTAQDFQLNRKTGCPKLEVIDLTDIEKLSLHTITLLLINLPELRILDHNHLHEALWMMDKTGMDSKMLMLKLLGYNGRGAPQCKPDYLEVLAKLCPRMQKIHLCMTWPESFFYLSRFRDVSHLSIFRVCSVENFDLPMMAFGRKLVKLELTNCTNFQSGTALNIRKYCENLQYLRLEIDSTDANSNAGIQEALEDQNIHTLENQVSSLQERLTQLQITMLDVMNKYGNLKRLEELHLRNLGMGSLLILLPFCPELKALTLKYSLRSDEAAPNLTDSLFLKIFDKNKFENLQKVEIWCKSLSIRTAEWFVRNCQELRNLKSLGAWNTNEEEQVALWREGRRREPYPVEIDF